MDTLSTFWDNITHYKTESVHFWGLMNSATKFRSQMPWVERAGFRRLKCKVERFEVQSLGVGCCNPWPLDQSHEPWKSQCVGFEGTLSRQVWEV